MKAAIHSRYGHCEVLQLTTLGRPLPQKNGVLILEADEAANDARVAMAMSAVATT